MPYVLSIVLLVLGVLLLLAFVLGAFRALRRLRSAQSEVSAHIRDRVGLLKARTAALRVAFAERLPRSPRRTHEAA